MRRVIRLGAVIGLVMALGMVGLLQVAGARQGGEESPHTWVVVCHRTLSATHPFVLIVVAEEATTGATEGPQHGGHNGGHDGDVFLDVVAGFSSHLAALEFAHANRGNEEALCTNPSLPPKTPPAIPPTPAPGAPAVTG